MTVRRFRPTIITGRGHEELDLWFRTCNDAVMQQTTDYSRRADRVDQVSWKLRRMRCGRGAWLIGPEFLGPDMAAMLLRGESQLRQRYALERVRSAVTSRVFKCQLPIGTVAETVYHKEYLDRSMWDAIKHLFRATRALRSFRASQMLEIHGFRTPVVLAVGQRRVGFLFKRSVMATLEVSRSNHLLYLLGAHADVSGELPLRVRRDLIRSLGRIVGSLHAARIVHGDLRLGNVLARRESGCWEFYFLDNERTRKCRWFSDRLRLKNLVQVNMIRRGVSATDRMRFFQAYLSECPELRPLARKWMTRVLRRTAARLEGQRRRTVMA